MPLIADHISNGFIGCHGIETQTPKGGEEGSPLGSSHMSLMLLRNNMEQSMGIDPPPLEGLTRNGFGAKYPPPPSFRVKGP